MKQINRTSSVVTHLCSCMESNAIGWRRQTNSSERHRKL